MKAILTVAVLCFSLYLGHAAEKKSVPINAPAHIELHDQYDAAQTLTFPTTNVTVITIADRRGSEQVAGWVDLLKSHYLGRIQIHGLADVGGAPGFIQGKIRRKFQESHKYPVMLDWTGKVCAQFGYEKEVANVLIIDAAGVIVGRFHGPASEQNSAEFRKALEKALATTPKL